MAGEPARTSDGVAAAVASEFVPHSKATLASAPLGATVPRSEAPVSVTLAAAEVDTVGDVAPVDGGVPQAAVVKELTEP